MSLNKDRVCDPANDNGRLCVVCASPVIKEFHPFCSRHCAYVDLNRWFKGSYAIPGAELPEGFEEEMQDCGPENLTESRE